MAFQGLAKVKGRGGALLMSALALLSASGCSGVRALEPKGPVAARIAELWWFEFFLALPFFLAVVILLLLAIRRRGRGEYTRPRERGMTMILWGGIVLPAIAMLALMSYMVDTLAGVAVPAVQPSLTVSVQGELWWWRVGYASGEEVIFTANEIHIPAGEPVILQLSSDNVIHSFWVPELNGKRDLIPGVPDGFWLQADHPGTYHGQCAEFCGAQHAKMHFLVIAHEPGEFAAWLTRERQPAPVFVERDEFFYGQQAFLNAACIGCHTVRGTPAAGKDGPDLTHIASRQDLGAGTLPNVTGNLTAWIVDSQVFKPGNPMPPMPLSPDSLMAIVGYLQSLK